MCRGFGVFVLAWMMASLSPAILRAQVNSSEPPSEVSDVNRIEKHYDGQIPLDTPFQDDQGHRVKLGDFFGSKPVVISLNYSDCPMLCDIQLREFVISAS